MGSDPKFEFNPFDPDVVDDQDETLSRLRSECPVAEVLPGTYYVARHADILEVCRKPDVFRQGEFHRADDAGRDDDQRQLGETNPPEHTPVRKAVASGMTTRQVKGYEPFIRETCVRLVDALVDAGGGDLIEMVGAPLPAAVIGYTGGFPEDTWDELGRYSDDFMVLGSEGLPDDEVAAAGEHVGAFDRRFLEVIAERRAATHRPADMLTALVEAVGADGQPLSDVKVLTHLTKDIIVGGIETTTHMIGNLFWEILNQEGIYGRLADEPKLIAVAVEETLRHLPPVQILFRQVAEDTELAGTPIPAGSTVALGYASANRDADRFEHPERFDVDRGDETRHHLGFGWGIHLCAGAALARAEARILLETMVERAPTLALAPGESYERVRFFMMRGPRHLNVTVD